MDEIFHFHLWCLSYIFFCLYDYYNYIWLNNQENVTIWYEVYTILCCENEMNLIFVNNGFTIRFSIEIFN